MKSELANSRYREILDKFESTVLDGRTEETISHFLYEVLDMIKPFFHPDLVELQEIKYTDTYGPIRFLQKIYTNLILINVPTFIGNGFVATQKSTRYFTI